MARWIPPTCNRQVISPSVTHPLYLCSLNLSDLSLPFCFHSFLIFHCARSPYQLAIVHSRGILCRDAQRSLTVRRNVYACCILMGLHYFCLNDIIYTYTYVYVLVLHEQKQTVWYVCLFFVTLLNSRRSLGGYKTE